MVIENMLLIILLIEGFISISVEILTIRQLLPFFGGSVVITSVIIGVFLLFLSIGYWRGGGYQQNYFKQLSQNFTLSMVWLGIGLSYHLIAMFYYLCVYQAHLPLLVSLFLYLLLVLAPVVYWLGQTIPLTMNLFRHQHRASYMSGRALFLSTIGSFLGSLLTTLLLFQYLGVAWTIVINSLLLFTLIIYMRVESQLSAGFLCLLLLLLVFIGIVNLDSDKMQFIRTNNYANYQVIKPSAFSKLLQINLSNSSLLTAENKGFPYIEFIRDLLFNQLHLRHKQILVIGAGGFSLTAAGAYKNEVTYIDIDPDIKQLAEKHFLNHAINGVFIAADARGYLQHNNTAYDVIVSDVYSHQTTIPPSLLTVEYFQSIANHLNPDGILVMNLISSALFRDDYARIVFNTIHAVFPYCSVMPVSWRSPLSNVLYICPKMPTDRIVYRDDLTTATLDFLNSQLTINNL